MAPYEQYVEQSTLTATPLELVRIVYRVVLESVKDAARCVDSGDITGRGKAVTKATDGILQLLSSLNHEQGGAISRNLAELYGYMASRLLQGHLDQDRATFEEVEKLVTTLLEAWEGLDVPSTEQPNPYGAIAEVHTPICASF
ncbi:MAG TPA: flagellar export chaperone FliS [Bryobacteraceae bacterium]|nr:flagellar export chaperone FliS [Bryobacteraceae bacterium]